MNHFTTRRHRAAAALGVTALALGSLGLLATPAFAVPGDGGTGSITVHKLEQPAGAVGPNDGTEITNLGGARPLVAGFTSCAIENFDLSVASNWDRLRNITVTPGAAGAPPVVAEAATALTLTDCLPERMTDATNGTTAFADLPADRAYVVWESTQAANAISAAQPTLITVPYPGADAAGTWNYNPHIYPKNVVVGSGATKNGQIIGDKVTFDVNVPINPLAAGETFTEFRITDRLSSALTHTGGSVRLLAPGGAEVPLVAADYTLTAPTGASGSEVVLSLTATGLAKLDANVGGTLILTITADAIATGSTANEAALTINGKTTEGGEGPSVIAPENFFASAHILKMAQNRGAQNTVPLAGAEFSIYPTDSAATDCAATPAAGSVAAFERQTSAANGNTPNIVLAQGKYCVYETLTPAGYKGLNGGMLFDVTGENATLQVLNTQIGADQGDLPSLPLTGSAGSVALLVAGGALIVLGTTVVLVRRRAARAAE
ncbi:SpaH/EbpB family LPXTG-anchored major pilin [Leucobacter sp. CSA2]|uniref:SpaH/EbpB family LPXTG-anchored major pilin n=1 Tax=Leucobacter edaphi TaxID=2796472 RepID=A0A934QDX6_9MICO|nr:SpaH/EbpB family LPXTG-anchored major pilin [Leucobacter edaphi]